MTCYKFSQLALATFLFAALSTSSAESELRGQAASTKPRQLFWYSSNLEAEVDVRPPWQVEPTEAKLVPEGRQREQSEDELPGDLDGGLNAESADAETIPEESEDNLQEIKPQESADAEVIPEESADGESVPEESADEFNNIPEESEEDGDFNSFNSLPEEEEVPEARTKQSDEPSGSPTASPTDPSVAASVQRVDAPGTLDIETDGNENADGMQETEAPDPVLKADNDSNNTWKYLVIGGAAAIAVAAVVYVASLRGAQLEAADTAGLVASEGAGAASPPVV